MSQGKHRNLSRIAFAAGALLLAVGGCSKPSGGPLDGNWVLSNLTCNGQAIPVFNVANFYSDLNYVITISNASGTLSQNVNLGGPSCRETNSSTLSYSGTQVTTLNTGNYSCAPVDCAGGTCGSAASGESVVTYAFNGVDTLVLTTAVGDTTCTMLSPPQSEPLIETFTRQ